MAASSCRAALTVGSRSLATKSKILTRGAPTTLLLSSTARPFFSASRALSILGGVESLMPLHSAIASARLRSNIAVDSSSWSWLSRDRLGLHLRTTLSALVIYQLPLLRIIYHSDSFSSMGSQVGGLECLCFPIYRLEMACFSHCNSLRYMLCHGRRDSPLGTSTITCCQKGCESESG